MSCNCKKNAINVNKQVKKNVMPSTRGVNNSKPMTKIKRVTRRQFK